MIRYSLLTIVSLVLTFSRLSAAPLAENETVKLSDGKLVKVLSISKIEYSKGVMALMIRYQTSLSIDAHKELSDEVDNVWKVAVKDVEHFGFHEAIVSSNQVSKGLFLTSNRSYNFIFEKGPDGKWNRLGRSDFMASE